MAHKKFNIYLLIFFVLFISVTNIAHTQAGALFLKGWWEKGPLINIEKTKEGKLKYITGAILINAPIKKVWEVLIDFEEQPEFISHLLTVKAKKEDAKTFIVDFTLQINFLNYVVPVKYTSKLVLTKLYKRIDYKILKGDIKQGYGFYELVPSGKNKTILFHGSYIDLSEIELVKTILKQDPRGDTLLAVGTTLALLKSIKREAEK